MPNIEASEVAALFGVSISALHAWHRNNILRAHPKGVSAGYSQTRLNAFLTQKMRGKPSQPITFDDLRLKRIELVDIKTAHTITGIPMWKLYATVSLGEEVTSLHLSYRTILLVKTDVEALPRPIHVTTVTYQQAACVLGVGVERIERWVNQQKIQRVQVGKDRAISYASLVAHAATLLPDWINAAGWVAEMMDSPLPLLSFTHIKRQFGQYADELLSNQKLRYITPLGDKKKRFISPVSVMEFVQTEEVVTVRMLAMLFDEHPATIDRWSKKGYLKCHLHLHVDGTLYKSCAFELLRKCLNGLMRAPQWYSLRLNHLLYAEEEAAEWLGVPHSDLTSYIAQKKLKGIQTPDGEWKFTLAQLTHFRREQRKQE